MVCTAGEPVDLASIYTSLEVWLDLTVFNSEICPPLTDLHEEVR
jgi:hypothetical protein